MTSFTSTLTKEWRQGRKGARLRAKSETFFRLPFGHMRARDFPSGGMAWIKQFKSSDKMKTEILLQY
jgi:hypothetical protein